MKNYYENQLKLLQNFESISIQLSDYDGNKTKNMSLNAESIDALIKFFEKLKEYQSEIEK